MSAHLEVTIEELRLAAARLRTRRRTRRRAVATAMAVLAAAAVATAATGQPLDSIVRLGDVIVSPFGGGDSSHGFPASIACSTTLDTCRVLAAGASTGAGLHPYRLESTATLAAGSTNAILGMDVAGPAGLILCARPEHGELACHRLPNLPPSSTADGVYRPVATGP